ncbi:MAG: LysR family transcriptional regulator [Bdellovibrionaceae bacterium]|nr:LysR family transcriptional regulator [Pseudobdellovibrionaceae bacterium]
MDLNEIKSFIAIAESQSLTLAAQKEHIPKSTLSRHLLNLENRLGVSLLQRTTRKISLTTFGKEYYKECSHYLKALYNVEKELIENFNEPKGLIKFTAPVEIGNYVVSETIAKFSQLYPEIQLQIEFTDRVVDLLNEEFDLALRAGGVNDQSLVCKKLGGDTFVLVASENYLKNSENIQIPEDLKNHKCWIFSQMKKGHEWRLSNSRTTKTVVINKKLLNNSMQSIKRIIIADGGIAYLPLILVKESILSGELVRVLAEWKNEVGSVNLCYFKKKKMPLRLRLFIDFIYTAMSPKK